MNTYNCPRCNSAFEIGTKFCSGCGFNLENEYIVSPICPRCHKTFPTGTKFCSDDGFKLTSADKLIPRYVNVYPKASLGNRFLASLLDSLITYGLSVPAILFYIIGMAQFENNDGSLFSVALIVIAVMLFFIPLTYMFFKDGLRNGQSWGKRALGLRVIHLPTNAPCTKGQSFLRALIDKILYFIPFVGWLIEPIMVLATTDGRRVADRTANTQVIETNVFNN